MAHTNPADSADSDRNNCPVCLDPMPIDVKDEICLGPCGHNVCTRSCAIRTVRYALQKAAEAQSSAVVFAASSTAYTPATTNAAAAAGASSSHASSGSEPWTGFTQEAFAPVACPVCHDAGDRACVYPGGWIDEGCVSKCSDRPYLASPAAGQARSSIYDDVDVGDAMRRLFDDESTSSGTDLHKAAHVEPALSSGEISRYTAAMLYSCLHGRAAKSNDDGSTGRICSDALVCPNAACGRVVTFDTHSAAAAAAVKVHAGSSSAAAPAKQQQQPGDHGRGKVSKKACPHCATSLCSGCGSAWQYLEFSHLGKPCAQWSSFVRTRSLDREGQQRLLLSLPGRKLCPMPSCGALLFRQRGDNCHHVTCRCGAQFCYVCLYKWRPEGCRNRCSFRCDDTCDCWDPEWETESPFQRSSRLNRMNVAVAEKTRGGWVGHRQVATRAIEAEFCSAAVTKADVMDATKAINIAQSLEHVDDACGAVEALEAVSLHLARQNELGLVLALTKRIPLDPTQEHEARESWFRVFELPRPSELPMPADAPVWLTPLVSAKVVVENHLAQLLSATVAIVRLLSRIDGGFYLRVKDMTLMLTIGKRALQNGLVRVDSGHVPYMLPLACRLGVVDVALAMIGCEASLETPEAGTGATPLLIACERNLPSVALQLISAGAFSGARTSAGHSPLTLACFNGMQNVAMTLMDRINSGLGSRAAADALSLWAACSTRMEQAALRMASLVVDVDVEHEGTTPLLLAIENGMDDVAIAIAKKSRYVFRCRGSDSGTALHAACRKKREEVAATIVAVSRAFDIADLNAVNCAGETALLIACDSGMRGVVEGLIHRGGVDLNRAGGPLNMTPLMVAISKGFALSLINAGASVNHRADDGASALSIACTWHLRDVAMALLDKGASVNARLDSGLSVLHIAINAAPSMVDVTLRLIEKGADPHACFPNRDSPMDLACDLDAAAIVEKLVKHGADINARSQRTGLTPLQSACIASIVLGGRGEQTAAQWLISAGADLNLTNDAGDTALMMTCASGFAELALELIGAGADLNCKNVRGETALTIAKVSRRITDMDGVIAELEARTTATAAEASSVAGVEGVLAKPSHQIVPAAPSSSSIPGITSPNSSSFMAAAATASSPDRSPGPSQWTSTQTGDPGQLFSSPSSATASGSFSGSHHRRHTGLGGIVCHRVDHDEPEYGPALPPGLFDYDTSSTSKVLFTGGGYDGDGDEL